jgi:hypothetical protein
MTRVAVITDYKNISGRRMYDRTLFVNDIRARISMLYRRARFPHLTGYCGG